MKLQAIILTTMIAFGMTAAKAQVKEDSVKKFQQIEKLFKVLNLEEECTKAAISSAEQTLANTPTLADKKEATTKFFTKYLAYSLIKDDLVKIYAKYYTTQEIEDLTAFYKTSAGKKFSSLINNIAAETMQAYSNHLQEHAEELTQIANGTAK